MTPPASTGSDVEIVVLIHGLWMTTRSWERWIERFQARGCIVVGPAWPGLEGDVEDIRRQPAPLRGLGVGEVADHYERIIRGLERPPIIIGHSFGGLITQLLLDRGLGAAGVAVGTAPIKGVLVFPPSTLRAAWPALRNPFGVNGLVPLSHKQFYYRFTNTLPEAESKAVYDRFYIPGTARMLFQAALANFTPRAATQVNHSRDHRAPLLLISGDKDHISPPAVSAATLNIYRNWKSPTEMKVFHGRSHWLVGQEGWEEIADYALDWARSVRRLDRIPAANRLPGDPDEEY
jgi:alpha-beta hydrolase superfamily lysophospholipase